ncbi:MAG: TonB family protein, partial [Acidobacteriota bacterium]|nr:TonB family protein [Acidobacteriota bacterium]
APEIAPQPVEAPNMIAVKLPPKGFAAPNVERAAPADRPITAPDAPQVTAPLAASDLNTPKLPPKEFVAPNAGPAAPADRSLTAPAAPQLTAQLATLDLNAPKLPPKAFTAPATGMKAPVEHNLAAADAPRIGGASAGFGGLDLNAPKLPPKPFTAPSHSAVNGTGKGIEIANAPEVGANIAIVGLNPAEKLSALPTASSPGAFSAGPVIRKEGATAEAGGNGVTVPNLFVQGTPAKKPDLFAMAHAAPTSEATIRAALSKGEPMAPPPAPPETNMHGATQVSGAPTSRFNGREVFMMAIQMPQITSYSGSWLMWYAAHTAKEASLAPIAPPIAHRKADPKYIASAISDRIEGSVTLGCVIDTDGHVSDVELLRGIDERLNDSAKEALAKWEFFPATRNGVPVAVDVVVEIPFKLEPAPRSR